MNLTVQMHERNCQACGKLFKVMTTSLQEHCSAFCKGLNHCQQNPKTLKLADEKPKLVVIEKSTILTPPIEKKSWHVAEYFRDRRRSIGGHNRVPKDEMTLRLSKVISENAEEMKTEKNISQTKGPTMSETATTSSEKTENLEKSMIPRTGSEVQSTNSKEEISHSSNLLRNTATHLYGLMTDLNPKPENRSTERLLDVERVRAAAECGKQIISTIRMQHDIIKLKKELEA